MTPDQLKKLGAMGYFDSNKSKIDKEDIMNKLWDNYSELTSRQIGAVLRFYESRGWVASRVVREDNCKRKLWYITENGYKVSDWQPKNTNNSNLE